MLSFAGCNYLGLAHEPRVLAAATIGMEQFGLSMSASRETSGNTVLHESLEAALAQTTSAESVLVVPDGYTANLAAAQTLRALGVRYAVIDERAHRSLRDAATAAGMNVTTYPTTDVGACGRAVAACGLRETVVMTDGVFTSDGRLAPIKSLAEIGCRVLVDDCHGFGVLGQSGSGSLELAGLAPNDQLIMTCTLAKGIGCAGGFVAASASFVAHARDEASAYVCTTPTPPALVAAAIEAVRIVRTDNERRLRLQSRAKELASILSKHHLGTHTDPTPIRAFSLPSQPEMQRLAQQLDEKGIFVPLISYPGGPAPLYFRASVTSEHTTDDLHRLDKALGAVLSPLRQPGVLSPYA